MFNGQEFAAVGVIAGSVTTLLIISLVVWILLIIARWKIFTKAGEAGWKSIIPIYSDYIQWRISWKKIGLFWAAIALAIVGGVMVSMSGVTSGSASPNMVLAGLGLILVIVAAVMNYISIYKLMVAFGHGAGWFILSILFTNIMLLVLGFGSSQYSGPQD